MGAAYVNETGSAAGTQIHARSQIFHIIPVNRQWHRLPQGFVPDGHPFRNGLFFRDHLILHDPRGNITRNKDREGILPEFAVLTVTVHFHAPPMDIANTPLSVKILHGNGNGPGPESIIAEVIRQRGVVPGVAYRLAIDQSFLRTLQHGRPIHRDGEGTCIRATVPIRIRIGNLMNTQACCRRIKISTRNPRAAVGAAGRCGAGQGQRVFIIEDSHVFRTGYLREGVHHDRCIAGGRAAVGRGKGHKIGPAIDKGSIRQRRILVRAGKIVRPKPQEGSAWNLRTGIQLQGLPIT
ncbi:MAG: hypothetical protein BWX80_01159 [Candidatus Hydrogenedentes bacterium ADurb.Bin101]|nr:MAG: hypothetical protein BWX80_01159 [Candidatus Hydrogenedentes bacterium ADurb.Bin101]